MRVRSIAKTTLIAVSAALSGCATPTSPSVKVPCTSGYSFSELPPLPDPLGFAGAYAGEMDGNVIVVGGANFPDGPPWRGGTKTWHDTAFVLLKGEKTWRRIDHALPSPRGYGGAIATRRGLLCVGGGDAKQNFADVFLLKWTGTTLERQDLPPLPVPLANFGIASDGLSLFVVGGNATPASTSASDRLFTLDLLPTDPKWRELEPLPGPGRILPATAGKFDLFVVSGASLHADDAGKPTRTYLTDAYRYKRGEGWKRIADLPHPTVAAPAIVDQFKGGTVAILGGDDGANVNFEPKDQHPGFSRDILVYSEKDNTWRTLGKLPFGQVTTTAFQLGDGFVLPSGEIRPAVRTPVVTLLTPVRELAR